MSILDPLTNLSFIFIHMGGRFLKFNVTPVQEKLLSNPMTQTLVFFSLLYFSSKNFYKALIILIIAYIFLFFLLNENCEYNILFRKWLIENEFIEEDDYISDKDLYKNNMNLHLIN